MRVTIDKLPKEWVGMSGKYYKAKAVDQAGKLEFTQMVSSFENLPKFIEESEQALKEQCSKVIFHDGLWTKTREEIMK